MKDLLATRAVKTKTQEQPKIPYDCGSCVPSGSVPPIPSQAEEIPTDCRSFLHWRTEI